MANEVIITTIFRVSFPHLKEPQQAQGSEGVPKYSVSMMVPQSGVCHLNNAVSSFDNIRQALDKVCLAEFGFDFNSSIQPGMGIEYPPKFKDGNQVFQKDAKGDPIPGKVAPETAGMEILTVKNAEPVGCVDPGGTMDIDPGLVYGGCWARAELEVSAYKGKKGRVVAIKLLNVQKAYDDTPFGNAPPRRTAKEAFGSGAVEALPLGPMGSQPSPTPVMNPGEPSYDEMIAAGWTDETLVAHGKAKPNYNHVS